MTLEQINCRKYANNRRFKAYLFSVALLPVTFFSCQQTYDHPHLTIQTDRGKIEVELYEDKAPKTVAAFLNNVDAGTYTEGSFYRVLSRDDLPEKFNSGLIQGGVYESKPQVEKSLTFVPHESPKVTGLSHTDGTISMARTDTGTAKSEFFICIGDQSQFDSSLRTNPDGQGYAAFGRVVEGMEIVREIQNQKKTGDKFTFPIKIKEIKRL